MRRVLVIEDDPLIRANLEELLDAEGFDVEVAADGRAGVAAALARPPDVIVCDIMLPVLDGHGVLKVVRDHVDTAVVPFIFLTARAEREDVRAGMSLGADDYVTKPFTRRDLLDSIEARIARLEAFAPTSGGRPTVRDGGAVVAASPALRQVYDRARRAARGPLSILLLGETGSGKDVLARAIHDASPRAGGPFLPLNCAALPADLLESELFGHERGAFTGAGEAREGLFEAADGGTVFLDEIGDLPTATQAKLLRVLEDRRVRRVGGRRFVDVDVRFLAATNRDLDGEIEAGAMRRDLYFRIAGMVLRVPPLRDRPEDIRPLAERFVANACAQLHRASEPVLLDETVEALRAYPWPGNVRELRNAIEQAVTLLEGTALGPADLPRAITDGATAGRPSGVDALRTKVWEAERQRVVDALERHAGNQTRAAEELGISRRTLLHRLDEYDLPRPRKKS